MHFDYSWLCRKYLQSIDSFTIVDGCDVWPYLLWHGAWSATWPYVCWGTMLELGWGSGTAWKAAASHFFQNLRVAWRIGLCFLPQKIERLIRFIGHLPQIVTRAERPFCTLVWSVSLWKQSAIWDTVPHSCVWVQNSVEIEWTPLVSQFTDGAWRWSPLAVQSRGTRWLENVLDSDLEIWSSELCGRLKISWCWTLFLFKSWVHI